MNKEPIKILPIAMHPATVMRFWAKVSRSGDDCWEWIGGFSQNGYGAFKLHGKSVTAPRMAYALSTNDDPLDLMVLHTCDNRKCCNPSHLYKGDVKQNTKDMVMRGRSRNGNQTGSFNGAAKLNEDQVVEIRRLLSLGQTNMRIAFKFGVTHQMISKIRRGHFWQNVPHFQGDAA